MLPLRIGLWIAKRNEHLFLINNLREFLIFKIDLNKHITNLTFSTV